ncbi:serine carboxypeptidase-like protein [Tanacetum coccineum]
MVFPPSIICLCIVFLLFISSSSTRTYFSTLSSLEFSQSLKKTGKKLIEDLNLHPNFDVNLFKAYKNYSNDELNFSEFGIAEKRLQLHVLGDSGATVHDLAQHAGYFRIKHTVDARFFYFFFESRRAKGDPVVIWLTGGPGCASELALFYENGPFKLTKNLSLIWNDYGWDKVSNIIFVDQPTGTGFSYSSSDQDTRHDETGISNDLYKFLQAFFKAHPDYVKNDFYITGESYAGHYIPALATRINRGNKNKRRIYVNLKGFAIGNGLTNPEIQYPAYTDYALANNIISVSDYDSINTKMPGTNTSICYSAFRTCQRILEDVIYSTKNINYYDIRKKCEGNLCYDFSEVEKFLSETSVKTALGVPSSIQFVSCNHTVYEAMIDDWMRNLEVGIPALLEQNIQFLVYAGEYDLICNWLGNWRWVHAMPWSGQKEFVAASNVSFIIEGKEAGILKNHGPLTFLKVRNAGHLVPMDQPDAALKMLELWTSGKLNPPNEGAVAHL